MLSMNLPKIFSKKSPNQIWVSDITYIKVGQKWYYLCVIIDLFSRKVVSWKISDKPDAELVISTFKKAYADRNFPVGLMFHSDRGSQYTSATFRKLLNQLSVVQSFSGKGYVAESFFKFLKLEEINQNTYSSFADLKSSLFEYINGFYNWIYTKKVDKKYGLK